MGEVGTAEAMVAEASLLVPLGVQIHIVFSGVEDVRHTDLLQIFHVLHSFACACNSTNIKSENNTHHDPFIVFNVKAMTHIVYHLLTNKQSAL